MQIRKPSALLFLVAAGATGCGSHSPSAAGNSLNTQPGRSLTVRGVVGADAVASGGRIIVAAVGRRSTKDSAGPSTVQVVSRSFEDGAPWRREPPITERISSDGTVSVAQVDGSACVGFANVQLQPYVACLRDGRWREIAIDDLAVTGGVFNQLGADGKRLLVLMKNPRYSEHTILGFDGRTWRQLGAPIKSRTGIARMGIGTDTPTVAVEEVGRPPFTRTAYVFEHGTWRQAGPILKGLGLGPLTSGPARVGSRSFLAVTDTDAPGDWPFSVYTAQRSGGWFPVGGGPLNRGRGSAQEVVPTVVELRAGGRLSEFSQTVEAATSGVAVAMVV